MNWMQSLLGNGPEESGTAHGVAASAVDPVSGETLARSTALTSVYGSKVYYFASRENRERFEAAPAQYAAKAAGEPVAARGEHSGHRHGGCC